MGLSESDIKKLAAVLAANEPFDDWRCKVRRIVVEMDGAVVTMSRRSKYAALRITKVEGR